MLKELVSQIGNSTDSNDPKIGFLEEKISDGLLDYCKEPLFYSLSIFNIISIVKKNKHKFYTTDNITSFLFKASEYKKEEAHFLLHCFDPSEINLEECIQILSSLPNVPILSKLCSLYKKNKTSVGLDWKYETNKKYSITTS